VTLSVQFTIRKYAYQFDELVKHQLDVDFRDAIYAIGARID